MRTPVEEAGLAGQRLAAAVRRAVWSLPPGALARLLTELGQRARADHLVYVRDDVVEAVRVFAAPIAVLPDQLAYVRTATLTLTGACQRLPDLYAADPAVAAVLRLPPAEEAWLRDCWSPAVRENNPVFARHDAVCDFASPGWQQSLAFLEPNLAGVGGLHMIPAAERALAAVVVPALHAVDPALELELGQDIRALLMQEIVDHLAAIGRGAGTVAFVEPRYEGSGPDEQDLLARYFHDHFGVAVCHVDPSELTLRDGEVYAGDRAIDLAYRDYGVVDLLEAAADGVDVEPMRALFRANRMVSSIAAELDQKSIFELFTDPVHAHHWDADQHRVFRRHVPWTRLCADRATTLPDGRTGELLPYLLAAREDLVLKPNRAYGGTGVTVGAITEAGAWAAAVDAAVADPERWVAQRAVTLPAIDFPVADAAGAIHAEPFYVVYGFAASIYGLATLGRASPQRVVNVAQRGGLCPVMIGHPPGRMVR